MGTGIKSPLRFYTSRIFDQTPGSSLKYRMLSKIVFFNAWNQNAKKEDTDNFADNFGAEC